MLFGADGIAAHLRPGAVIIACPTIAPDQARALATRCEERGLHYLDAPISGGAAKAARGALSVMASGSAEAFAAAKPVLDTVAETVFDLGPEPGAGSAMKAINQMLAGVHIAAMAEAVTFGMTQGISAQKNAGGDPAMRRHLVDVRKSCAPYRGWRLHPPFRRRYLAQGSRHRARDRARREILCTAHRRRPCSNSSPHRAPGSVARTMPPWPRSMRAMPGWICRVTIEQSRLHVGLVAHNQKLNGRIVAP